MPVRVSLALLLALPVLGSAAQAAEIGGSDRNDRLVGTGGVDVMHGRGGHDYIEGRGGGDFLDGGVGRDLALAGAGNDRIAVHADGERDAVFCGVGHDIVNAELRDVVPADCEVVVRQLSRDESAGFPAQLGTQVEPDSLAVGSTIVTAFQSGRLDRGWSGADRRGRHHVTLVAPGATASSRTRDG